MVLISPNDGTTRTKLKTRTRNSGYKEVEDSEHRIKPYTKKYTYTKSKETKLK